jgi:cell division septum initiation protein DivIVA
MSTATDTADDVADRDRDLAAEVERLRQRIADLEARLDEADASESSTLPTGARDHRDAAVLEALEAGERVTSSRLQKLYRERTDIHREDTVQERQRALTKGDAFEILGPGRFRYRPDGDW